MARVKCSICGQYMFIEDEYDNYPSPVCSEECWYEKERGKVYGISVDEYGYYY